MSATTTDLLRNTDNEVIPQYWDGSAWVPYSIGVELIKTHTIDYSALQAPAGDTCYFGENTTASFSGREFLDISSYSEFYMTITNNMDVILDSPSLSGVGFPKGYSSEAGIAVGETREYIFVNGEIDGFKGVPIDLIGTFNTSLMSTPTSGSVIITVIGRR